RYCLSDRPGPPFRSTGEDRAVDRPALRCGATSQETPDIPASGSQTLFANGTEEEQIKEGNPKISGQPIAFSQAQPELNKPTVGCLSGDSVKAKTTQVSSGCQYALRAAETNVQFKNP